MSRLDVLRSLVREAAQRGGARLGARDLGARLERVVSHALTGVVGIDDSELTAAVARVAGIAAATVTSESGALRVDAALENGRALGVRFVPREVKFAPAGAKEISVRVDPSEAADDPRVRDVFAALAGCIARALWRPALRTNPSASPSAFVTREHDTFALDLRTVPEVQAARRTRLGAVIVDMVALRAFEARAGGLTLRLALPAAWR